MKIDIKIHNKLTGIRLDSIVSYFDKTCSRAQAVLIINNRHILVNNLNKKPGYKVKYGDWITGTIVKPDYDTDVVPDNINLNIIFEDNHIIVINKKPGMVVHPAPGNLSKTLVNALLFHYPKIKNIGNDSLRAGIVHRLDKDTSGLMVVAKTDQALHFLQKEFKQRRVQKKYLALVSGNLHDESGVIKLPIGRHPKKRKIMAVNHQKGKSAETIWKIKQQFKNVCLIEALLKTGRTHQIRVHFYAIDHPLIGEKIYQYKKNRKNRDIAPRQMLHSSKLSFQHPYFSKIMSFKAMLPEDFIQTICKLDKKSDSFNHKPAHGSY